MATIEQKKIQKNAPSDSKFNTEVMIPISEIKDGVIIMKDWGIRSILKVEGLNLDLKNFDEIQVIFEQYKRFLNSLNFPIQILVRNTYLDLTNYLNYIKENIEKININALKQQGEEYYKFLERIDTNQGLIFVKEFYIIVPFYSEGKETEQINKSRMEKFMNFLESKDEIEVIVDRYRKFLKNQKELQTRVNVLKDGLAGIKIQSEALNTAEIVSLLFRMYNPLLDSSQSTFVEA